MKIAKIIKIVCSVFVFAVIGLLVVLMIQNGITPLDELKISDAFSSAYAVSTDVRTHAVNDEYSKNGAVYAYGLFYNVEGGYLQVTVRYNTRHIDEIQKEYPDFSEDGISYTLFDKSGNEYTPRVLEEAEKFHYRYFKLEFENVPFTTDLTLRMNLEGLSFDGGELVVHYRDDTSIPYEFSKKEKEQLEKSLG